MKEKDENKWKEIISKCDSNHDGKISFPEFTAMMENMVPHDLFFINFFLIIILKYSFSIKIYYFCGKSKKK